MTRSVKRGFPLQEELAKQLHRMARVPQGPCGLQELQMFQTYLSDYQIVVVCAEMGYQIIFKGPHKPKEKQLILVKTGEHYHACTSLSGFFGSSYFCTDCEKSFKTDDTAHHKCRGKRCYACEQRDCTAYRQIDRANLYCPSCCRYFFSAECYANHLQYTSLGTKNTAGISVCQSKKRCPHCNRMMHGKSEVRQHRCGHSTCPSCEQYLDLSTHQCFIQPILQENPRKRKRQNSPEEPPPLFVYYDIEAMQDTGVHVPNLLCAETSEGVQVDFHGPTCIENFLEWLDPLTNTNTQDMQRQVIAVAHNAQGYDSYFLLEELYKQCVCPQQIVNGAKILSMSIEHVKFIDSMAFLQMPLARFPKSFGLCEMKKGFFPHFFNRPEFQNYRGPMPAQDYYDPKSMNLERFKEFEQWYRTKVNEGTLFDFQKELLEYCRSDVRLLKEGCTKFQQEFQTLAGFNPMQECITIASACNRFFRKKCLLPHTLACEPLRGWIGGGKPQSYVALEWLNWTDRNLALISGGRSTLKHAGNVGEVLVGVGRSHVDGFDPVTNTIYEFNGCFFHGCPICFANRDQRHAKLDNRTLREVYDSTVQRIHYFRDLGYNVTVMWECTWNQFKQNREDVRQFLQDLSLTERLKPRDAFFGGRTNAIQLHCTTGPGEEIRYVDVTSLYPSINKEGLYPVGHPEIISNPTQPIDTYFGLARCKVLPPYELYHPVLPYRCKGKLVFPLCRTCTETQIKLSLNERTHYCSHEDHERTLTGTWCTPELMEAKDKGYTILKLYEVWHFPKSSTQLFRTYVDTFLKLKQEASGWPTGMEDDPTKQQQYVADYLRHEGVELEAANIAKNPGKRALAKMMLNSFWGKFGQQSNKTQVQPFSEPSKFYQLLQDNEQKLHSIRIVNDHMIEVVHNYEDDATPSQTNINIFVAAFTTCLARLKLYRALDCLKENVLYFDTDSIIYHWKPNGPALPLGNYLGQFTNELDHGDYIVDFAAAGPKNYGYRTFKGKVECKVRGFRLNTRGQEQLNFDILKNNIIQEITNPQSTPNSIPVFNPHKIVRDPETKKLKTQTEIKRYQLVFDKRVVEGNSFKSYPYGYSNARGIELQWSQVQPSPLASLENMVNRFETESIYDGLLSGSLEIFS